CPGRGDFRYSDMTPPGVTPPAISPQQLHLTPRRASLRGRRSRRCPTDQALSCGRAEGGRRPTEAAKRPPDRGTAEPSAEAASWTADPSDRLASAFSGDRLALPIVFRRVRETLVTATQRDDGRTSQ